MDRGMERMLSGVPHPYLLSRSHVHTVRSMQTYHM